MERTRPGASLFLCNSAEWENVALCKMAIDLLCYEVL